MNRTPFATLAPWPVAGSPWLRRGLALLLLVAAAACGNLTAGGFSEAEVTVSGDAPDPAPTARQTVGGLAHQSDDDDDDDDDDDAEEAEGEIEADFFLYLLDGGGQEVALSDDEIQVEIDVRGEQELEVAQRSIPTGRYTGLRVVFTDIEVEVDAGLVIDGRPITGSIDVDLEGDSLAVTRPLDLTVEEGRTTRILVDLNTRAWLALADPDARRVPREFFANALRFRVR